jgi:hypothetical protein
MKTNTIKQKSSEVTDRQNFKIESDDSELNIVAVTDQDLFSECTYGLEYIVDELFPEGAMNVGKQAMIDWAGFDDLMI